MGRPSQGSRDKQGNHSAPEQLLTQERLKVLGVCCFLLLAVVLVFRDTTDYEFTVCDDQPYVSGNPHVNTGLTWENVWWSITSAAAGNWHPLTWMSHMVDVEIYGIHDCKDGVPTGRREWWKGPEAGGHHTASILLHAAGSVVLFLALRRMTGALWCSAFVAAMFALHPLHVESVAWVAERKDVLSGLFWMLTLLAYGGYALRPSVGRYLAVVAMFGLGLASKSMLVTLPCVLLLLDFWPLRRWQPASNGPGSIAETPSRFSPGSIRWLVVEKLPLLAMSAGVCTIVAVSQHAMGAMTMIKPVPFIDRVANAAIAAVAYLWMMIWPFNLAIFYPHLSTLDAADRLMWQGIAAGALLVAITLLVLWNLRKRPYLAVGWFWYLGSLVPVIGLIQVGAQSMADRYTYLPMVGIAIMLVWGVAELAAKSSELRAPIAVAAGLLLAGWTVLSVQQVGYWKNSVTLFQHAIEATQDNYFAYNHRGLAYQFGGDLKKAEADYIKAVEIAPSYDAANANLGANYANRGEFDKALPYFQAAVDVNGHNAGHRYNLGYAYMALGNLDTAEAVFRKAIELEPSHFDSHWRLFLILYSEKRHSEAVAELHKMVYLYPEVVIVLNTAAFVLATSPDASMRDGKTAVEWATRAVELTKEEAPAPLDTLAAAYAETRQFPLAIETAGKAKKLALWQKNAGLAKVIGARISLYEDGKPYREPPPAIKKTAPATPDRVGSGKEK